MNIHSEKEYLKELKFTHEKQMQLGKITNASNTLKLIEDCEKRIEHLNKFKPKLINHFNKSVIWQDLIGYETTHEISNSGLVKKKPFNSIDANGQLRNFPENIIKPHLENGYLKVIILVDKKARRFALGNLVYSNFIDEIPAGFMARNKDGDIYNCESWNLTLSKISTTNLKYRNKVKVIA